MTTRTQGATQQLQPYTVRTHNASEHSENRMHSDDVARQFGFKAALVPGVTVFAHMTRPLVEAYGERWLARGVADVKFSKPAYEGDLLTVRAIDGPERQQLVCVNEEGLELARMTADVAEAATAPDKRTDIAPAAPIGERPVVTWDLMEIGKPFPALTWSPTQADNAEWCADVREDLPLYTKGDTPPLHPGLVLRQANYVLRNRFTLPAWIHAASRVTFHDVLRVGRTYEVRAIPEEKWERKGHEMVRLYVAIRSEGRTYAEVLHTAIFRPRVAA